MIKVGPITLESPVGLAPMSGITDLPFRRRVKWFGAGWLVSEMVASRELIRRTRQSLRKARIAAEELPVAVQLAGTEPEVMAEAARINEDRGASFIDINFGCPAKKVVGRQAGSALMRDESLALRIMEHVAKAVSIPVTVKMRTGWDDNHRNAPRLARMAEACGVRMITVHGRTRCQLYDGASDWAFIGEVKDAVSVPVIANGDIRGADDAARCLEVSGADGVMIGRACQGRPWLLAQVAEFLRTGRRLADPPAAVQRRALEEHYQDTLRHYGLETGVRAARKHVGWYAHGRPGAATFRAAVNNTMDPRRVRELIDAFYGPMEVAA